MLKFPFKPSLKPNLPLKPKFNTKSKFGFKPNSAVWFQTKWS